MNEHQPRRLATIVDGLEFNRDASLDDVLDEEPDFLDEQRAAEDDSARVPPADVQLPITRESLSKLNARTRSAKRY